MLWFSEHLHLGDEVRAGAQEWVRMSVGDLFTPSLGFADVSRRWPWSATGMKGELERRGGANVSRRSVHAKPRIRGRFVALERHGDDTRLCVALMCETRIL